MLILVCLIFYLAYTVSAITVPVIVGLAIAYVCHPLTRFLHHRWHVPRVVSTVAVLLAVAAAIATVLLFLVPPLVQQITELLKSAVNEYWPYLQQLTTTLLERIGDHQAVAAPASAETPAAPTTTTDPTQYGSLLIKSLNIGAGVVGTAFSYTTYFIIFALIVGFCFFYFSWHLDRLMDWITPFIPRSSRDRTLALLAKMDRAVSAFVRGRLIQSLIMAAILCVGWFFTGPSNYWLVLGLLTGLFNLVPYLPAFGWLSVLALVAIDQSTGGGKLDVWTLIWPSIVYFIAQGLDGWVVEPLVQGRATDLDPLTVLLAVLTGGALAGLLGLILAIPVTACAKILLQEEVFPRIRKYAEKR